jgi:hypothetical protein
MLRTVLRGTVLAAAIGAIAAVAAAVAENVDPSNAGAQYAWGENIGWINAEPDPPPPDVPLAQGVTVSGIGVTGYMWGENIGWINMSCQNNGTCGSTGNYGVTNDGLGNLSGYAWGENIGWISFSCQNNPGTCASTGNYGVDINPLTGEWTGSAWGENIGWINFSHNQVASRIRTTDGDTVDAGDNCPFDANQTQINTDLANQSSGTFPGGDTFGDVCDSDDDADGCTDFEEGTGSLLTGGLRNSLDPWDFFDVPAPALPIVGSTKNKGINLGDVGAALSWVGRTATNGTGVDGRNYNQDNNANGVLDGKEYDRVPAGVPLGTLSGPPNGAVSLHDVGALLAQVGHNCAPAPN